MQKNFKRIISAIIALSICVTMFAVLPFTSSAATVTHDVTGDAASKLGLSSNYDLSLNATNISTTTITNEMVSTNLVKADGISLKRFNTGEDITKNTSSSTVWSSVTDGVYDNNKTHSNYIYYGNIGDTVAALTVALDGNYELSDFYLLSAYHAERSIYAYEVYVSDSETNLYESNQLVLSYNYSGYVKGDVQTTKLNTADNKQTAEGQIYTFNGTVKPQGKYVGIKITGLNNFNGQPYWLYISELGIHGTRPATVTGDVFNNEKLSFYSKYDLDLNATNISTTTITEQMVNTNLVTAENIKVTTLTTGEDVTSQTTNSTWASAVDGIFDYERSHKNFTYYNVFGDSGAYLTISLGKEYVLDDFYMLSAYHAPRSIYAYEIYVGKSNKTLYNAENLVLSYNYDGYQQGSADGQKDTIGKLNTADGGKNAEGQIYTFNGNEKPTGNYIGVKITGMNKFETFRSWLYFSELGAHGKSRTNLTGDIFSNPNFSCSSNYDLDLNATNISANTLTEEMVSTNLVTAEGIKLNRLNEGGDITASSSHGWGMVIDGKFDTNSKNEYYTYYGGLGDTGAKLTISLGGRYVLSDFYMLSAFQACRSIYAYEIYVGNNDSSLYNKENLVFSYNYSGYVAGNNTAGKLNIAGNAEGQLYTFNGAEKPIGSYIGVKITGINNFTGQETKWLYFSELGAHGTKIENCTEHEGRDMTVKSSIYDNTIFDDSVTYQETAFFYEGREEYKLLYPIDEIITVRSYDLKTEYFEGVDFVIENGKLYLTKNTSIPVFKNPEGEDKLTITSANMWNLAGYWPGVQYKYQLHISYTHSKVWDENTLYVKGLDGKLNDISKFHEKALSGETTNVIFLGDSITEGCNASGMDTYKYIYTTVDGVEIPARDCAYVHSTGWDKWYGLPSRPTWANDTWSQQITDALTAKYGDNIVMTNRGIGSTSARWINQFDNIEFLLGEGEGTSNMPNPDLVFIGYGMNEPDSTKEQQNAKTRPIIEYLRNRNPDCSIVLVSAFVPNMPYETKLSEQEQGFYELAKEYGNMIVAPVNSIFQSMLSAKHVFDYTGNLLNHPSDFGVNVYADTILAVLEGNEASLDLSSNIEGVVPTFTGSTLIGGTVVVTAPEVEGYTFSHFEVGTLMVYGDENNSITLSMASDKTVKAIYTATEDNNTFTVTFVDNNGAILKTFTVEQNGFLDLDEVALVEQKLPEIFGYIKGYNGNYWNADPSQPIVYDQVFSPRYIKDAQKTFTLTLNDGGEVVTTHAFDDAIQLSAKGEGFAYWKDAITGNLISTNANHRIYMPGNISILAVYNEEAPETPTVTLNSAVNFINGETSYTAILTGKTSVPQGAIIESKGIIFTDPEGLDAAGGVISLDMSRKQIIPTKKAIDGNFMITNNNIINGRVRYAKAYVTYVLGGKVITEYSDYTVCFNGEVQ